MFKVAPSVLSASFAKLETEIKAVVEAGADLIHLDVMDGVFVPNITFGPMIIQQMPRFEGVELDAHLMIINPEAHLQSFFEAKVDRIALHVESTTHLQRHLRLIRENHVKSAVALNPSTSLRDIEWVLEDLDMVVIMSVNPGFGGQKFIERMIYKVEEIKEMIIRKGLKVEIEVDGGVTPENAGSLKSAGMDIAVAGSAVFGKPDYAKAITALKEA
ncbi:MAG: ribulose-phosphate 3-epimerase [Deltaproteobacteria bacterium]|nr:ribulose-phosphate 3-epimerase [Deltaproteobacteria bacterium]